MRQRITPKSILEIEHQGYYYYAQILKSKNIAFFGIRMEKPINDIKLLDATEILFILKVYNEVINSGLWLKIGKMELRASLLNEPYMFIQDTYDIDDFSFYLPVTGEIIKATREECIGLERAAVWEANHVHERLSDYFDKKENKWVKQLEIK